jgi:hypothetical protein
MLDHTHHRPVTPLIRADRTEFSFGNIPATLATPHAGGRRCQGLDEGRELRRLFDEQMQSDAFRRTVTESGQLFQLPLQPLKRWRHRDAKS